MSALIVLVIASILVAASFLVAFVWSVKNEQYNDNKGVAMRMLFDDDLQKNQNK